jgi:hypothetical protein
MIFTAMITISFAAAAQDVYESVDQQGVVEFGDQPTAGARVIDVAPNVVDVAPPAPVELSQPAHATGEEEVPGGNEQTEVIREGVAGDYYVDDENRRDMNREREGVVEPGEAAVHQPVRNDAGPEAGHETVHEGAHRR